MTQATGRRNPGPPVFPVRWLAFRGQQTRSAPPGFWWHAYDANGDTVAEMLVGAQPHRVLFWIYTVGCRGTYCTMAQARAELRFAWRLPATSRENKP